MTSPAKYTLAALLGATLLSTTLPAFAQSTDDGPPPPADMADADDGPDDDSDNRWGRRHGKGHHGGMRGGMHGGPRHMIIDANADGVIGADEAAMLAEGAFRHMDQNRDEAVDKTEFTTPPHGGRGGWRGWFGGADEAAAVQKVREDKFVALDTDKDGKVTKLEFFAEAQAKLAAADSDKDGKVSPWEFRALPRM